MPDLLNHEERDLLIELRTDMKSVKADLREMKDNTSKRVDMLEHNKMDKDEAIKAHTDYEARLRFIEKYVWSAIGAIGLIEIVGLAYILDKLNN